ncbi:MAG TPA: hypothetical protein PKK43_08575, partial [Spirochaetota bacterium]|nr:hypothetical protein [Spirochaetota bacterium]
AGIMSIVRFILFMFFRVLITGIVLSAAVITSASAQKVPADPVLDNPASQNSGDQPENKSSKNMNVDMQLTYGQYNNMFSTISLSHEQEKFVYLLNSQFKRSNDYGYGKTIYSNTSYYENNIGFTGNLNAGDGWKTIFDGSVDNESHGMYENPVYTREEKEKYSLSAVNIIRQSSSFEWNTSANVAGYTHRLAARDSDNDEKSSLLKLKGSLGGEIIWSASNRLRFNVDGTWYRYNVADVDNDDFVKGEMIDDFRLLSFLRMSIGLNGAWAKNGGALIMGRLSRPGDSSRKIPVPVNPTGSLSLFGNDIVSVTFQYRHEMEPFRAENFYFEQKYVYPEYDLSPTRSHVGEGRIDIKGGDYVWFKGGCVVKKSDDFYDYVADEAMVLRAHKLDTTMLIAKGDGSVTVPGSGVQVVMGYEYSHYYTSEHITYRPAHSVTSALKYNGSVLNIEWSNRYQSRVYTDPEKNGRLKSSVIGFLGAQVQMLTGFYSYLRVENLYNNKYYLRDGYPEAGLTVLGGLRILL